MFHVKHFVGGIFVRTAMYLYWRYPASSLFSVCSPENKFSLWLLGKRYFRVLGVYWLVMGPPFLWTVF